MSLGDPDTNDTNQYDSNGELYNANKWETTLLTDTIVNNLEHQVGTATDTTNFSLEKKINNLEYLKLAVTEIKQELVGIDQNELRDIEQDKIKSTKKPRLIE